MMLQQAVMFSQALEPMYMRQQVKLLCQIIWSFFVAAVRTFVSDKCTHIVLSKTDSYFAGNHRLPKTNKPFNICSGIQTHLSLALHVTNRNCVPWTCVETAYVLLASSKICLWFDACNFAWPCGKTDSEFESLLDCVMSGCKLVRSMLLPEAPLFY